MFDCYVNGWGPNWFLLMSEGSGKTCRKYSILQWGSFKSCLKISKSIAHFEPPLGLARCGFSCVGRLVGVWNGLRLCLLITEFSFSFFPFTHTCLFAFYRAHFTMTHMYTFNFSLCVCQGWLWVVSVWKETRWNGKKIPKDLQCHIVCVFVCLTCLSEDHISL